MAVAQVYQPRHVILEATGPFRVQQGGLDADVTWTQLEASLHVTGDGFQRASLVADGLKGAVTGADPSPIDFTVDHLELHARPTPGRFAADGAVDLSARVLRAGLPVLDPILGGTEPADIALDATVTRATGFRTRPVPQELERWREAGGTVEIASLAAEKGSRRLRARGRRPRRPAPPDRAVRRAHRRPGAGDRAADQRADRRPARRRRRGADRQHRRPVPRRAPQGAGAGPRTGDWGEFPGPPGEPPLKVLPTVRLTGGRVVVGPFAVPNVRLQPLY